MKMGKFQCSLLKSEIDREMFSNNDISDVLSVCDLNDNVSDTIVSGHSESESVYHTTSP